MFFSSSFIYYFVLISLTGGLMVGHNRLLKTTAVNPFKRSVTELTATEQWTGYGVLVGGSVSLILSRWIVSGFISYPLESHPLEMVMAIGLVTAVGFFTVITLNALLATMRENTLSLTFFTQQNFLLVIYLIALIELSFLNWLKEVSMNFLREFFYFVVLYSLLTIGLGIFLGMPKVEEHRIFPKIWQWRLVILINPLIVVLPATLLVKLVVDLIFLLV